MYMYLFFLKFFPHLGYYRLLSSVPCTMLMSDVCCHGFICHLRPFCCSVAKSFSSSQSHGLQHTRLLCPSHLPEFAQVHTIESVMPSNHLILCSPLLLLPSIFPSIRVFSNESVLPIRWSKYWRFSLSISPFNEYSGLISFRMDWLGRLAVQGFSRVFSNTTVWKHQFFGTQPSLWSNSHINTWLLQRL